MTVSTVPDTIRDALPVLRTIGATGHAERLGRELGA